jgi:hypothetical protein
VWYPIHVGLYGSLGRSGEKERQVLSYLFSSANPVTAGDVVSSCLTDSLMFTAYSAGVLGFKFSMLVLSYILLRLKTFLPQNLVIGNKIQFKSLSILYQPDVSTSEVI